MSNEYPDGNEPQCYSGDAPYRNSPRPLRKPQIGNYHSIMGEPVRSAQDRVPSTSDERTVNNDEGAMRHNYRVLTEAEKFQVTKAKDIGQLFLEHLRDVEAVSNSSAALDQSRIRIEEAVMWAVKHITK